MAEMFAFAFPFVFAFVTVIEVRINSGWTKILHRRWSRRRTNNFSIDLNDTVLLFLQSFLNSVQIHIPELDVIWFGKGVLSDFESIVCATFQIIQKIIAFLKCPSDLETSLWFISDISLQISDSIIHFCHFSWATPPQHAVSH
jgi:hypothetical protein